MYVLFMVVLLSAGAEQTFHTYPRDFVSKAECEYRLLQQAFVFTLEHPDGEIIKAGCAKLKVEWDA